jgi:hypothetical protein
LSVPYFHVVYTLPSELRDVAYQNKRVVFNLLMTTAAETTLTIAADPKRLGARIGTTAVLHTWGDNTRWVAARSNFLVHVNVLARLFRGKMLAMLVHAHDAGELKFFNSHAGLGDKTAFQRFIAPLRRTKWVAYCKAPFAGPEQVLRYLSRYTHRVAIANRRVVAADSEAIAFRWKDYRLNGANCWKTMRLPAARVHQALPAARIAQGLPPHPPLRALCLHQPRREHRDSPRTPQCRPT